jgi:hypothetical protein
VEEQSTASKADITRISDIELARAARVAREISFNRDENPEKLQWYLALDISNL